MTLGLSDKTEAQKKWRRNDVDLEKDGYFLTSKTVESQRLLAMVLTRIDRIDASIREGVFALRIVALCAVVIVALMMNDFL